jgi:hypothetical protein
MCSGCFQLVYETNEYFGQMSVNAYKIVNQLNLTYNHLNFNNYPHTHNYLIIIDHFSPIKKDQFGAKTQLIGLLNSNLLAPSPERQAGGRPGFSFGCVQNRLSPAAATKFFLHSRRTPSVSVVFRFRAWVQAERSGFWISASCALI